MRKQRHGTTDAIQCPMEAALDVVGGKWKGIILFRLSEDTKRFNELSRLLCKITARTLTKQLRELESDGLISRRIYAQVPPKVEYSLTDKGRAVLPALELLKEWGSSHVLEASI